MWNRYCKQCLLGHERTSDPKVDRRRWRGARRGGVTGRRTLLGRCNGSLEGHGLASSTWLEGGVGVRLM